MLGIVALHEENFDDAVAHLKQANAQSPYGMFQLAKAYAGKKDAEQSKAYYRKAAEAYTLPDIEYAMIRHQAKKALAKQARKKGDWLNFAASAKLRVPFLAQRASH